MKLIIFGSTGTIGQHLVTQALAQGHEVTAFARRPERIEITHNNLTRISGDVLDPDSVKAGIEGHDAVIIALGAGRNGGIRAIGTTHIIDAMKKLGLRRLICQSTLGVGDSHQNLNFLWKYIMFGILLRPAFADHVAQEAAIKQSHLDWIIVRAGAFTDGPATGAYKHGFSPDEKNLQLKISRADVAGFILQQLTHDNYLHKAPGLSN